MPDYERTNARLWDLHHEEEEPATDSAENEWATVTRARQPSIPHKSKQSRQPALLQNRQTRHGARADQKRPQRPPPKLASDTDNEAAQTWRNHAQPTRTIHIPYELVLLPGRAHETLARQNGAFLACVEEEGPAGQVAFGLWGDSLAVSLAFKALCAWIRECTSPAATKSHGATRFTKLISATPQGRRRLEKAWLRDVKRQRYRKHPPIMLTFEAVGFFYWPVEEYHPEEILGGSCEALDPIRMDCKCYVTFTKESSTFKVCGDDKDVKEAMLRLRKTCFQIAARQINPIRLYRLYWPGAEGPLAHVYLQEYDGPKAITENAAEVKKHNIPRGLGVVDDPASVEIQTAASELEVKESILQTLRKLHYYRGHLDLRIRLGTFLATSFRKAEDCTYDAEYIYGREDYEDMTKESQFAARITHELGDRQIEQAALTTLQNRPDLLQPLDAMLEHLTDVQPIYSATFQFEDSAGDLYLNTSWREAEETGIGASIVNYDVVSQKWTRLDRDTASPTTIYDASLQDLQTGLAWRFGIEGSQIVEEARLPPPLANFAESVRLNPRVAQKTIPTPCRMESSTQFVTYKLPPLTAAGLKSFQQRISYRYALLTPTGSPSEYTVELTQFQNREYSSTQPTVVFEPRWALEVYRTGWATAFAQNAGLKIGAMAEWGVKEGEWFPEDGFSYDDEEEERDRGLGFAQLMEKLKKIAKVVTNVEMEDLMGRMTVN